MTFNTGDRVRINTIVPYDGTVVTSFRRPVDDEPMLVVQDTRKTLRIARESIATPIVTASPLGIGVQIHPMWSDEASAIPAVLDTVKETSEATWVRMDIGWSSLEQTKGTWAQWAVDQVDAGIKAAKDRGFKIVGTFWRAPTWANSSSNPNTPPLKPVDYAQALVRAVTTWPEIDAWEVWNEPNLSDFWPGADPVAYAKLCQAAYGPYKATGTTKPLVVGSTSQIPMNWWKAALAAGLPGDALSVHPYMSDSPPETYTGSDYEMRQVEQLFKLDNRPVWFTEFGWSAHSNTSATPVWARGVSESVQADYATRTMKLSRSYSGKVPVVIWYCAREKSSSWSEHERGYGLVRRDTGAARPALAALK